MTSDSNISADWRDASYEDAEEAINRMVATEGFDEDATLNRLQALRLYIERLMSALR